MKLTWVRRQLPKNPVNIAVGNVPDRARGSNREIEMAAVVKRVVVLI